MQLRSILAIAGVQAAKLKRRKMIWVVAMGPVGLYLLVAGPALFFQAEFASMTPDGFAMISWSVISGFGRILSNAGQLLALVLGALTVSGDLRDGTLFPALAKPVSRLEVISGKLLGSALVVVGSLAITVGLVADLIDSNRRLIELLLERVWHLELRKTAEAGEEARSAPAEIPLVEGADERQAVAERIEI